MRTLLADEAFSGSVAECGEWNDMWALNLK
ncbi:hypothetical protein J2S51_002777 [Streptomyces sp. DSM 41269]|nr:hypothetical protein [Streptomyces sp. DSM 41269]